MISRLTVITIWHLLIIDYFCSSKIRGLIFEDTWIFPFVHLELNFGNIFTKYNYLQSYAWFFVLFSC